MTAAMTIGNVAKRRISSIVPNIALRATRLTAETNIPAANENAKMSVTANTSRQNSMYVTPPDINGIASTGNKATSA
jgi:hypothetical protein